MNDTELPTPVADAPVREADRAGGRLVVALEHRFARYRGQVYSSTFTYDRFWSRYLAVFDEVHVLARVSDVDAVPANQHLASGPAVHWIPVPFYHGPWQFLARRRSIIRSVERAIDAGDAFMLRVPGQIGTLLWGQLRKRNSSYGVEVVGDPYEVFAPGVSDSRLRPLLRWMFTSRLRRQVRDAAVAAYVTEHALQNRYPTRGWSTHYSTVQLGEADFVDDASLERRLQRYRQQGPEHEWVCAHIGSMSQPYKRQGALIQAVADCRNRGTALRLRLVGSGRLEARFRRQAEALGVADQVEFVGQIPAGEAVRRVLDSADLFVLPSATEGLPRVIIEAMARGLPCLASDVGGTAELLDPPELFDPDDTATLGRRICDLVADTKRLQSLVARNYARAADYSAERLQAKRGACYQQLAACSSRQEPVV